MHKNNAAGRVQGLEPSAHRFLAFGAADNNLAAPPSPGPADDQRCTSCMLLWDDNDNLPHGGAPRKAFQTVLQDRFAPEFQELLGDRASKSPPASSGGEDDANVRAFSACQSTR